MNLVRRVFPVERRAKLTPFESMREEMDRLFNDWLGNFDEPALRLDLPEGIFMPRLDIVENEKELKVTVELPGLELKDVELELDKDRLLLKGHKVEETEEKGEALYRKERRFGSFRREIPLPWEVDAAKVAVNATFKNGVLTVLVPRPKEVAISRKKVEIKGT